MIQESDLRIGNLALINYNGKEIIVKILGIKNEKVEVDCFSKWIEISKIKPILISDNLFIDYGFQDDGTFFTIGKISIMRPDGFHKNGRVFFNSWAISDEPPKYLHDLQNLCWILNRKEIQLN